VVAELGPPRTERASVADALLADVVRRGWLTPPLMPGVGDPSTRACDIVQGTVGRAGAGPRRSVIYLDSSVGSPICLSKIASPGGRVGRAVGLKSAA